MIRIIEVKTKKEIKEFINFPLNLYKKCPYYVPILTGDEKKIFKPNYIFNSMCDVIFFLAYEDNKVVGRIQGIIQNAANEKWKQNRVRFTRFDAIDSQEVANALFDAVIKWAKEKGKTEIVGPLGYSDMDREGLLIEGFEELGTYEEQYNYDYYPKLIDNYGFQKEVDWFEFKLYIPKEPDDKLIRVSQMMLDKYNLTASRPKSIKQFIKNHKDDFFEIIDKTYDRIYGTVPFTKEMSDAMVSNFKLLLKKEDIGLIKDENGKLVGFALMFSSISDCVRKSRGRITLPFIFRFLKAKYRPKVIDMGLIGVLPEYESKGIATAMIAGLQKYLVQFKADHAETNLILETNHHMLNLTKRFNAVQNKKRRCYVKKI